MGWDHVSWTVNSKPCPFLGRRGRWLAPTREPLGEGTPWIHAARSFLWKSRAHRDWDQVGRHPGNPVFSWQALQHRGHCTEQRVALHGIKNDVSIRHSGARSQTSVQEAVAGGSLWVRGQTRNKVLLHRETLSGGGREEETNKNNKKKIDLHLKLIFYSLLLPGLGIQREGLPW